MPSATSMTGGPRSLLYLLQTLDDRIDPLVVLTHEGELSAELERRRFPVRVVPLPQALDLRQGALLRPTARLVHGALVLPRFTRALRAALASHESQVVWGRNVKSALLAGPAARALGVPFIWDVALEPPSRGLARAMQWAGLTLSYRVVAQSQGVLETTFHPWIRRAFQARFAVLAPGVSPDRRAALEAAAAARVTRLNGAPLRVLCVGTLTARKDQLTLLEAARRLGPDACRIMLVGDGDSEYRDRIANFATAHGLSVELTGWRDDVPSLMATADALVLCSKAEGVPHVIREAAFAGLPVVATDVGGVPDLVTDGVDGVIVPPGDPVALAGALHRLAKEPEWSARLGANAAARAPQRYAIERWADAYYDLLTEATRGNT